MQPEHRGGCTNPHCFFHGRGKVPADEILTYADWALDRELRDELVLRVGFDKADEVLSDLRDLAGALVSTFGARPISWNTLQRCLQAAANAAYDQISP